MKKMTSNHEQYELLSPIAPKMPKRLPAMVKQLISRVPEHMKPAAANALFPGMAAHMSNVSFRYFDNVLHEPALSHGTCMISGGGKGYIDHMNEEIVRDLKQKDKESEAKLEEWVRLSKKKGSNSEKPERPLDAPILCPDPDTTNAAFVQMLKDAERAGNKSLYCNVSEVDMLNEFCGSHKKLGRLIRNMTDRGKTWGAHRATIDGISGRPTLRLRLTFSCVPQKAQAFFRDCIDDGTLWRLDFNYVPKPQHQRSLVPREGNYDERFHSMLNEYLVRLSSSVGEIKVPNIIPLMLRLSDEMADIEVLSDAERFASLYHRSLVIAWLKGCILYVAEGQKWSRQIEEFVRWSLYYDVWSKIQIFAPMLKVKEFSSNSEVQKFGPSNMLDMLEEHFSKGELETLRQTMEKTKDGSAQLRMWLSRGYITYSAQTGLYSKTEQYMARHPKSETPCQE